MVKVSAPKADQTIYAAMSTPLQRYQQDLDERGYSADPSQRAAVDHLQRLYDEMVASEQGKPGGGLPARLWRMVSRPDRVGPIQGLYFWGGVGRGKTWLVDTFFDSLPFERKMRTHFHRFMQRVHRELDGLSGEKNPLELIAEQLARETRIICFDEFFVSDITDAMLLAGLLDGLFSRGVTLVATSNIEPQGLYRNGLQRARFLPAIDLLLRHTTVINVDGGTDYRLRALERAELYHSPLDEGADLSLRRSFDSLAPEPGHDLEQIEVNGRNLQSRVCAEDVIWFEFAELCDGPRSQNDYIELARIFHAILISNVPQLGLGREDQARRFINLVDELYDRNVKLVLSAEVPLNELYRGSQLTFEFSRTISRLQEMQSHEYLAREHRP
ncbi:MAG: cell division protein ZapE [Halieaceae bacterium]|jgi:cell division protein ZapE